MSILEKSCKVLIVLVIASSAPVLAEDEAARLFEAGEWAAASDAYTRRTAADPADVAAWFQLAVSARRAERYLVARDALKEAEIRQFSPARIGLERARLNVVQEDPEAAVEELRAVVANGFRAVQVVTGDSVLSSLIGNSDFDALVVEMARQAFPCEHDPAFSAFDFWVGEWDVELANGSYVGSNSIERAEHGCVLVENWTSASGGTGMSINYLDKVSGEWVQIWNAAGGSQIHIRGGTTGDGMLLTGTIHYVANGTTAPFRGLWTPLEDGRVRQFFEQQSADETWSPWFEGFYSKKSAD